MPREQQQSIAAQLVEKFPSRAPAWALHARFLENRSPKDAAALAPGI
jgi:hypothetical protein